MDGCMDVWMYGCMDVWMYGCMDVWMYGCMDVWMDGWMEERTDGRVDGWTDGWMDGWMGGWIHNTLISRVCVQYTSVHIARLMLRYTCMFSFHDSVRFISRLTGSPFEDKGLR